jgi:glucose-6-phosphate 1-epimerase
MTDLAALQRFARPNTIAIDAGLGGLPRVAITTPLCRGEIYLQGATITAWQPAGQAPVIWGTQLGSWRAGVPIRGGIPLCWPWFGPHADKAKPAHGAIRQQPWTLESVDVQADGTAIVVLRLGSNAATKALCDADFDVRLTARFGRRLEVELAATNTGSTAFPVGEAMHTYLAVGDVRRVRITGLAGAPFRSANTLPKPDGVAPEAVSFTQQTVHVATQSGAAALLHDPAWNRVLRIGKSGSSTTVLWTPWSTQALADVGQGEWTGFCCIESANAFEDAYQLAPGATHRLGTTVEVL